MRLDKYLSDMGFGTRSQVRELVRKGNVTVNSGICRKADTAISPDNDTICVNGRHVGYAEYEYLMLNKPAGVVSATEDKRNKTVIDCCRECAGEPIRVKDIVPVGRLDKDTEGLLLLTNDGGLVHRLLAPGKHVEKEYYVESSETITEQMIAQWEKGMSIPESEKGNDRFTSLPARWRKETDTSGYITITEGKYHQIKRMFETAGNQVTYLKRVRMGSLGLDESLMPGECRRLTEEELSRLENRSIQTR